MLEAINNNHRTVCWLLPEMMERMRELVTIRMEKIDVVALAHERSCDRVGIFLQRLRVFFFVKENQEWKAFFCELFSVHKCDFADDWDAFIMRPFKQRLVISHRVEEDIFRNRLEFCETGDIEDNLQHFRFRHL